MRAAQRGGRAVILAISVALIAAACSGSSDMESLQDSLDQVGATATSGTSGTSGSSDTSGTSDDGGTLIQVDRPPPLRQSLAGLDSYRLSLELAVSGTEIGESTTSVDLEYSAAARGWHMTMNSTSDGEPQDPTEMYWMDGVWCSYDGFEWAPAPLGLADQEFFGVFWNQMDFLPVVERPEFIGTEAFQGVPSRHYAFEITGLGLQSGAVASESAGEYWLAEDGGWLVGYRAELESRTGPESDPDASVTSGDLSIIVRDVGTPIAVSPPPECDLPPDMAGTSATLSGGTDASTAPPPADDTPLPLRQGLAQLDAYTLTVGLRLTSVNFGDTTFTLELDYSAAEGGWHQTLTSVADGQADTTEVYWKDGVTCQFDGEAWSPTELSDQEQEMISVFWNQLDFVPVVGDPTLIGVETVAGMPARHYTFGVAGTHPGALGTTESGEYWLAEDGGYLVRYRAVIGTAGTDPANALDAEMTMTMENINGQIPIDLPPECTAATADG